MTLVDPWRDLHGRYVPPEPSPYIDDPVGWVQHRLGDESWSGSYEILEALRDHRRVAVHACNDSTKSWTVARACAWWIDVHPIGTAKFLTTAPSWSQVRTIIWQEIADCHAKASLAGLLQTAGAGIDNPLRPIDEGLPGRVNQSEWWIGPRLVGLGRKPAAYSPESLQGHHAQHLLIVVDEASGIPLWLWEQFEKMLTNVGAKIIAIGNPDRKRSSFHKVVESGIWHTKHIDGFDTPNFTGEPVSELLSSVLISPTWVDEVRQEHGEDSFLFQSGVRGLFPADDTSRLISWTWLERSVDESIVDHVTTVRQPVELGVDVGETGDQTVIAERRGPEVGRWWRMNTTDSEEIADAVIAAIRATDAVRVKIDSGGSGFGVFGSVRRRVAQDRMMRHRCEIIETRFGWAAENPEKFLNWRAEMWWRMRTMIHGLELKLGPHVPAAGGMPERGCAQPVLDQFAEPKWGRERLSGSGREKRVERIWIEPKEDIAERLGRSPDDAEALLLAFVTPHRRRGIETTTYETASSGRRR